MSLKSQNKINPNFSMSSMTDIVFLLLIFFMLTSTLVTTNALKISYGHLNGNQILVGASGTTFSFVIPFSPKISSYSSGDGNFNYVTNSLNAYGPISRVFLSLVT